MTPIPSRPRADSSPPCPAVVPEGGCSGRTDRYDRSELEATDSDYLCPFCHDPLYVKDGTTEEACFNRACRTYINKEELSVDTGDRGWARHARSVYARSIRKFYKFGHAFLLRELFSARIHECKQIFRGNYTNINIVASVDYLLTRLDADASWGNSKDIPSFLRTLQQYYKNFDKLQEFEKYRTKYYITTVNGERYIMKYHHVVEKFHKMLGIFSDKNKHDQTGLYLFGFIDGKFRSGPIKHPFDFEAIYRSTPIIINQLNHVFKMWHDISQIHQYPSRPEDFDALFSAWTRCRPGPANSIDAEDFRDIYDGASQKNKIEGNFDQFLEDYAYGRKYAPILVFDGERYHFEYHDLLLYLLYMFSNNKTLSRTQTETGRATYDKLRQASARDFEEHIRQKLRNNGFEVLPAPGQGQLHIPSKKAGKEFDCVAVDREKKTVVIVEAKYEDMAPSSKAGTTMVDQLVLDRRRGLLGHAKRHHERRRLLKRHFASLKDFGLDLEGSFHDYTAHAVIVTKHEPLISRHMGVDIISYERFTSVDFRSGGSLTCPASSSAPQASGAPANAAPGSGPGGRAPANAAPGSGPGGRAPANTTTATTGGVRVGMPAPRTLKGEIGARPTSSPRPTPDMAPAIAARPRPRACRQVREADGPDGTAAIAAAPHFQATALITAAGGGAPHGLAPHLPVLRRRGPAAAPRAGRGKAGRQDGGYGPVAEGAKIRAVVPPLQRVHDRLHPRSLVQYVVTLPSTPTPTPRGSPGGLLCSM